MAPAAISLPMIRSAEDLEARVLALGFLPFFECGIRGFSIEACTPPELWFSETQDGPWEWKGPVARGGRCAYGKFFERKAGFVSLEWLPDFLNLRRDGYDFDTHWEEQLASWKDRQVYERIVQLGAVETGALKSGLNYRKGGATGFDTVITRLQMQGYVVIGDFVYKRDKLLRPYGWGVAEYTTPERLFGRDLCASAYERDPAESRARILSHLRGMLPKADETAIARLVG